MLDSPLAPGPQLNANTKEPIDTTNINISSNINNSNNIINTTNSQTITLSIQQLQQILGLHGLSVVQPGQTNSSQIPQFILLFHSLKIHFHLLVNLANMWKFVPYSTSTFYKGRKILAVRKKKKDD